jgi:hypothetical protein
MDNKSGFKKIKPGPAKPLDTIFISLTYPQVQNLAQNHLLVEKNPIGSQIPITISIQPAFMLRDWRARAPTQRVSGCDTSSRGVAFLVIEFVSSFFFSFSQIRARCLACCAGASSSCPAIPPPTTPWCKWYSTTRATILRRQP